MLCASSLFAVEVAPVKIRSCHKRSARSSYRDLRGCSSFSSRRDALRVAQRANSSAPAAAVRSRGLARRFARVAVRQPRGPSHAAPSARAVGSASRRRVQRWRTRDHRARSFAPGRSAGSACSLTEAADLVAECVPRPAADVITYIRPDGDRSIKRGHQPANDSASALGERWASGACLLTRTRAVERQTGLPVRAASEHARRLRRGARPSPPGSSWSTTCTRRPGRRPMPPQLPCARRRARGARRHLARAVRLGCR